MIFWVRGVWNRKIILRLRCKCNIYIKLSGFNVCYSKFRPHDVLKGTCLWSFHMLVMVTQQDGRKKRTVKRLCVTKVAWLILACCVVIFTWHNCFLVFYEKICWKESEVWRKVFSNKIIVTLVTQGLPSSFLSHPVAYHTTVLVTVQDWFDAKLPIEGKIVGKIDVTPLT